MKTTSGPASDAGTVTVGRRAGRLILALLLFEPVGLSEHVTTAQSLSTLANVPLKHLQTYVDEIVIASAQPKGPEWSQSPCETEPEKSISVASIPQKDEKIQVVEPEDFIDAACTAADKAGDSRAQALAVVEAWQFFFPEVNKVQELQPRKAKEWVRVAGSATTVFGWLGGVDEGKLLSLNFPLAYVSKMIANKVSDQEKARAVGAQAGGVLRTLDQGVPDEWRKYGQKLIDQNGRNSHVTQNLEGNILRIAGRVQPGTT